MSVVTDAQGRPIAMQLSSPHEDAGLVAGGGGGGGGGGGRNSNNNNNSNNRSISYNIAIQKTAASLPAPKPLAPAETVVYEEKRINRETAAYEGGFGSCCGGICICDSVLSPGPASRALVFIFIVGSIVMTVMGIVCTAGGADGEDTCSGAGFHVGVPLIIFGLIFLSVAIYCFTTTYGRTTNTTDSSATTSTSTSHPDEV